MFQLKIAGPTSSDCTSPYKVILDKQYTLQEFVDEVLKKTDEWGYIRISKRCCSWYNWPVIEYRYGKIITASDFDWDWIRNRTIQEVKASGGWTRMDYAIIGLDDF